MNMLYEGLKEKGALMLIPSSAVESMGMGGLMGAAALRQSSLTGGVDATGGEPGKQMADEWRIAPCSFMSRAPGTNSKANSHSQEGSGY
jgi:hypothetical protein